MSKKWTHMLSTSLWLLAMPALADGTPHFVIVSGDSTGSSLAAQLDAAKKAELQCKSPVERVTDFQLSEGWSYEKTCGHRWDSRPCGPYHYEARASFGCIRDHCQE